MKWKSTTLLMLLVSTAAPAQPTIETVGPPADRITIYPANPFYWQYTGRPVLLLGGSSQDNLFQIEGLEAELDLLVSAGGNYIRNTMSTRDPGNVQAFVFVNAEPGEYEARWIRLRAGDWLPERAVSLPGLVRTPDKDQWAVILKRADR